MHEPYKLIKFYPSQIYSENPKQLNQPFNAFQLTFGETDQNGGAQAKFKQVFKDEKLNTTVGTIKFLKPFTLNHIKQFIHLQILSQSSKI